MNVDEFLQQWHDDSPTLEVYTSGSTGTPKLIGVEKSRMLASARMTCDFLGLHSGDNAMLCMPVDYIAGKMMVVRAMERGMHLMCVEPSGHPMCQANMQALGLCPQGGHPGIDLTAMVPLQVWNTLQVPEEKDALCRHVRHLIIGGGAIPPELEQELRALPVESWSSYGMTETLSHIALRRMGTPYYTPLPGISLAQDSDGCLIIDAPTLCRERLITNDIAEFHNDDGLHFRILGRRDNTVCSGGIKIQIEEVEAWLHSLGIRDVAVTWRPDPRLGQALVYLTTGDMNLSGLHSAQALCPIPERPDSRYWLPRDIIRVSALPLTPTGKPDRARAARIASGKTV